MATDADIGYGTTFSMANGEATPVQVEIAEVYDITPPNETVDVIDATHMKSPNGYREFILGLTDPGDCSFEMNFIPGSESETLILAAKTARARRSCIITFPNGATWTFDGLVTGYEPAIPTADKMTCTVTYKVTGSVVRAAGAPA